MNSEARLEPGVPRKRLADEARIEENGMAVFDVKRFGAAADSNEDAGPGIRRAIAAETRIVSDSRPLIVS